MNSLLNCLLFIGVFGFSGCRISANLHEIDSGKYYRSAQLKKEELKELISRAGIKTIINLRGKNLKAGWYRNEVLVAQEYDVELIDIPMSAVRLPHQKDLRALMEAFETAERPMLIHCRAGADRTGEASAIYQMEYMGKSKKEALKMLSLKYGHTRIGTGAKRYFIKKLYKGKNWAMNVYDPCANNYKHYRKDKYCNATLNELLQYEVEADF